MYFFLLPLGLPGGDQVDGLPPAAIAFAGGQKNDVFLKIFEFFLRSEN